MYADDKAQCISENAEGINLDTIQSIRSPKKARRNITIRDKNKKGGKRRKTLRRK
jgi:hypothetical protein